MSKKRTPTKMLYGDYCFREAAMGRSPDQVRLELEERTRRNIRRSISRGVAMFKPDWPWLRGLQPQTARR